MNKIENPAINKLIQAIFLPDMRETDWAQALVDNRVFLHIANPDPEILTSLKERFSLDELHIKDICNPIHPPYFTHLEEGAFHLILRFPAEPEADEKPGPATSLSLLADARLCALIWPDKRRHHFSNAELVGLEVEECVCKIIHILVDSLLKRVYLLRENMDDLEDECLENVENADLGKLMLIRKELTTIARLARANESVIGKLMDEKIYRDNLRLEDAHEHMQRAAALAESKAEHALSVMQTVQSLLSQRLNEIMRFLALITVILTPLSIITGIFGMNFTRMEVLNSPHGFLFTITGMLLLIAILAAFFKIRKWW